MYISKYKDHSNITYCTIFFYSSPDILTVWLSTVAIKCKNDLEIQYVINKLKEKNALRIREKELVISCTIYISSLYL